MNRFQRVECGQGWSETEWATALDLCLVKEALVAFGSMPTEDFFEYAKVKVGLLSRFRITAEGFRIKLRQSNAEDAETGIQFFTQLASYFDRWFEMSETPWIYQDFKDLILTKRSLGNCHEQLKDPLREKKPKDAEKNG